MPLCQALTSLDLFDHMVLNANGKQSGRFLINNERIAMLDYLIACFLCASIGAASKQTQCFHQRVAFYKDHDGNEGSAKHARGVGSCGR